MTDDNTAQAKTEVSAEILEAELAKYPWVILGVHHCLTASHLPALPLLRAGAKAGRPRCIHFTQLAPKVLRGAAWPEDLPREGLDRILTLSRELRIHVVGYTQNHVDNQENWISSLQRRLLKRSSDDKSGHKRQFVLAGEGIAPYLARLLRKKSGEKVALITSFGGREPIQAQQPIEIQRNDDHWDLRLFHQKHRIYAQELFEACSPAIRPTLPQSWFPDEPGHDASLRSLWRRVLKLLAPGCHLPVPSHSSFESIDLPSEEQRLAWEGLTRSERSAVYGSQARDESISFPWLPFFHLSIPSRIHAIEELVHCLHLYGVRMPVDPNDRYVLGIRAEGVAAFACHRLSPERDMTPPSQELDVHDHGMHRLGYHLGAKLHQAGERGLEAARREVLENLKTLV